MIVVQLNKTEYNYLSKTQFLPEKLQKVMVPAHSDHDTHSIQLTEDDADEIRDLCGERLQLVGFDENYELTAEGKILESLIDKFFTS